MPTREIATQTEQKDILTISQVNLRTHLINMFSNPEIMTAQDLTIIDECPISLLNANENWFISRTIIGLRNNVLVGRDVYHHDTLIKKLIKKFDSKTLTENLCTTIDHQDKKINHYQILINALHQAIKKDTADNASRICKLILSFIEKCGVATWIKGLSDKNVTQDDRWDGFSIWSGYGFSLLKSFETACHAGAIMSAQHSIACLIMELLIKPNQSLSTEIKNRIFALKSHLETPIKEALQKISDAAELRRITNPDTTLGQLIDHHPSRIDRLKNATTDLRHYVNKLIAEKFSQQPTGSLPADDGSRSAAVDRAALFTKKNDEPVVVTTACCEPTLCWVDANEFVPVNKKERNAVDLDLEEMVAVVGTVVPLPSEPRILQGSVVQSRPGFFSPGSARVDTPARVDTMDDVVAALQLPDHPMPSTQVSQKKAVSI